MSGPASERTAFHDVGDGERCPWCATPRDGRFCEEDGYDFVVPPSTAPVAGRAAPPAPAAPAAPARWAVRVEADRRYYALVAQREGPDFASVSFPDHYPSREVALDADTINIGRAPARVTLHVDLTGPPTDAGVSRLHAVLVRRPDGGWAVRDADSTNGVTINYDDEPIEDDRTVPLRDGDRIHVGAYTTLVLARADPAGR